MANPFKITNLPILGQDEVIFRRIVEHSECGLLTVCITKLLGPLKLLYLLELRKSRGSAADVALLNEDATVAAIFAYTEFEYQEEFSIKWNEIWDAIQGLTGLSTAYDPDNIAEKKVANIRYLLYTDPEFAKDMQAILLEFEESQKAGE